MRISLWTVLVIDGFFFLNVLVSNSFLFPRLCRPSTLLVRSVFVTTLGLSASLLQLCAWEISGTLENEYPLPPYLAVLQPPMLMAERDGQCGGSLFRCC
jgi:hypothetical protein